MDQIHIDIWHKGVNVFCDGGTYSYASEVGEKLSLTEGHNTVKLEGMEQMNKKGAFLVTNWTNPRNIKHTDKNFTGTMISQNNYVHTRNIEKTSWGYKILDEVQGDQQSCEFYFHTPCEVKLTSEGFELFNKREFVCAVKTVGEINITEEYRSLYYLRKETINCIIVKGVFDNNKCVMNFDVILAN